MILCLAYVVDDGLKAFLVIDMRVRFRRSAHHFWRIAAAEESCAESGRRRSCCNALSRRVHQALNCSRISLGSRSPATCNPACSGLSNPSLSTWETAKNTGFLRKTVAENYGRRSQIAKNLGKSAILAC